MSRIIALVLAMADDDGVARRGPDGLVRPARTPTQSGGPHHGHRQRRAGRCRGRSSIFPRPRSPCRRAGSAANWAEATSPSSGAGIATRSRTAPGSDSRPAQLLPWASLATLWRARALTASPVFFYSSLFGAAGAGIGVGLDALHEESRVVYRAAASRTAVSRSPRCCRPNARVSRCRSGSEPGCGRTTSCRESGPPRPFSTRHAAAAAACTAAATAQCAATSESGALLRTAPRP